MSLIYRRPRVGQDLTEIAAYLGMRKPSLGLAFLTAAEETFALISSASDTGTPTAIPRLREKPFRRHPIIDFPNHLVFYLQGGKGIEVVRVLHGARDLEPLLRDNQT